MKVLLRVGLCCFVASGLMAQRGGGHASGGGGSHGGGTVHGGGGSRGGVGFRGGFGNGRGSGLGYGGAAYRRGSYGYGYGYGYGLGYGISPYLGYWDDPGYSDYSPYTSTYPIYQPPVEYNPSPNVTIIYPANPQTTPIYTGPAEPVMRTYDQYGQAPQPAAAPANPANGSPIYLIAMKDQAIRAAASYWVEGRTLHYVTLQREEKQVPLDSVDREFSLQLNRERRVQFRLPQE